MLQEIPTAVQKMKFSIKDFFSECDQIRRKLWTWSHSLKKPLMENFSAHCFFSPTYNLTNLELKQENPNNRFFSR